jgi:hypothetical protein
VQNPIFFATPVSIHPLSLQLCSMANGAVYFQIRPELNDCRVRQLYLPDTNILLTRFLAEDGGLEVNDYMPIPVLSSPTS